MNIVEWQEYQKQLGPSGGDWIYHYTSAMNAQMIFNTQEIRAHDNGRIPEFGTGVFMTKHSPSFGFDTLWYNNYKKNEYFKHRLQCAFAIRANQINPIKFYDQPGYRGGRDLWRNENSIDLKQTEYYIIETGY